MEKSSLNCVMWGVREEKMLCGEGIEKVVKRGEREGRERDDVM